MANLKSTIGSSEGFQPVHLPVTGVAEQRFTNEIASNIGNFVGGFGQGYAQGTAEEDMGLKETQVDADAAVSEAFKQPDIDPGVMDATPSGTLEPQGMTKADAEAQRADFLADAKLNARRIKVAQQQGKISTAEANNAMMLFRKRFANNPVSALWLADYDKTIGSSGGARNAFFGKTVEEKARDAITTKRMTEAAEEQDAAARLSESQGIDITVAMQKVRTAKADTVELASLETKQKLGALGATESARKVDLTARPVIAQSTVEIHKLIDTEGGAKAEDVDAARRSLDLRETQLLEEIDKSNMFPANKKAKADRISGQFSRLKAALEDNSYEKAQQAYADQNKAALANIQNTELLDYISTNGSARRAFVLFGADGMGDFMDLSLKMGSPEFAFEVGSSPVWNWVFNGVGEVAEATDTGATKLITGAGDPMTEKESVAVSKALEQKGIGRHTAAAYELDPAGVGEKIDQMKHIDLEVLSKNDEWKQLNPEFIGKTISANAKHAKAAQMASGGMLPDNFTMKATLLDKGGRRNWTFETGGVELSSEYKSALVGAYRFGEQHPELWEDNFASISDWVSNQYAYKGTAPAPQDNEQFKEDRAKVDATKKASADKKQAAKDERLAVNAEFRSKNFLDRSFGEGASEAVGNVLGKITNLPTSIATGAGFEAAGGKADYDNPEYQAYVKENNPKMYAAVDAFGGWPESSDDVEGEGGTPDDAGKAVVNPQMAAVVQVETGGEKNPWIRTKSIPEKGSTAYGPLQVTKGLAEKFLKDKDFTPEETKYLKRFVAQADKFNKYGDNPVRPDEKVKEKEGYDPRYDYGGEGELTSEADKAMYWQVMTKVFNKVIGDETDPEVIAKKWHGGEDEAKIADYVAKLRSASGV